MNINDNQNDYLEKVSTNIFIANTLNNLPPITQNKILTLLNKKEEIKQENGLFASVRLSNIDKKIYKIRKKGLNSKEKSANQ